jgi:hypothetical protein
MDPVAQFSGLLAGLSMWAAYVIVASFLVEGVCDLLFGWRHFESLAGKGLKVPIAFSLSMAACWKGGIDPFAMAAANPAAVSTLGLVFSAGFVAGGSKKAAQRLGSMKKAVKESQA